MAEEVKQKIKHEKRNGINYTIIINGELNPKIWAESIRREYDKSQLNSN